MARSLLVLALVVALAAPGLAVEVGTVDLVPESPIPAPILERLTTLVRETLATVFGDSGSLSLEDLKADPEGIATQIEAGLNEVLEYRGYRITELALTAAGSLGASAHVELATAGVEGVSVTLDPTGLHPFWQGRHQATLDALRDEILAIYRPGLIGLPLGAIDQDWARDLALDGLTPPESLRTAFPAFTATVDVDLAPEAQVVVELAPAGAVVEGLRVQARSETLLMATLDSVEEALLAQADLVLGQPVVLIEQEREAVEAELAALAEATRTARRFQVPEAEVLLAFSVVRPTEALVTVEMESDTYHLRAEAFVDIGNDRSPAEFQAHGGYLMGTVELFGVLNVHTEEPTVNPDLGLGFASGPYFAGGAWDISEGALKYYVAFSPSPLFRFSAEGYADRDEHEGQDQFGGLYQPTQQLGVGVFTDAEGLWWARASFRL